MPSPDLDAAKAHLAAAVRALNIVPGDAAAMTDPQWLVYRAAQILVTREATRERYEVIEDLLGEAEERRDAAWDAWGEAHADQCAEEDAESGDADRERRARAHYGSDEGGYSHPGAAA